LARRRLKSLLRRGSSLLLEQERICGKFLLCPFTITFSPYAEIYKYSNLK